MNRKELYQKMKDILRERGLVVGRLIDNRYGGRCCILGAYGLANGYTPYELASDPEKLYKQARDDSELDTLVDCAQEVFNNVWGNSTTIKQGNDLFLLNDRAGEDAVYAALDCAITKEEANE
jgi:hypothetical protein